MHPDLAVARIERAYGLLQDALESFKEAGADKTAQRVRLAISSAKGARRNAESRQHRYHRDRMLHS